MFPYISATAWTTSSLRSFGTSIRVADTHAWPDVMATATIAPIGARCEGVVEVDLRRLAAQLERDPLHRRGGLGEDLTPDRGRAR